MAQAAQTLRKPPKIFFVPDFVSFVRFVVTSLLAFGRYGDRASPPPRDRPEFPVG